MSKFSNNIFFRLFEKGRVFTCATGSDNRYPDCHAARRIRRGRGYQ